MKKLILTLVAFFAMASFSFAAWTVTPLSVSQDSYSDKFGEHFILKLKCVSDGSTGTFVMNQTNLTRDVYSNIFGRFMFSMMADPEGGTTSAITPTITNAAGATIWADTTRFTNTGPVMVPGGLYSGYPPHFTDSWTITFNDIGAAGEVYILHLDFLR